VSSEVSTSTSPTAVTPEEPAQPTSKKSGPLATSLRSVKRFPWIWILLIQLVMLVVFTALKPGEFGTATNFKNMWTDASILLVLGVGMTFVIITAGIDLSVGSVLVFSGVVAAKAMEGGTPAPVALIISMVAGLAWGILNGFLVAKANIPALIVTLGSLGMALGSAQLLTGGVDVATVHSQFVDNIGYGRLFGQIPYVALIALAIAIAGAIVLRYTRFGRYTLAVGSNAEAARRAGINADLHLIKVYALMGALTGLAAFLSLARFSSTTMAGHSTDNLQAIAGVVLGGTSLFGGVGSVIGTIIGVFIPVTLQYGFVIVGIQPFWQTVAVGAVLIAAVYFDQLRRSKNK
jgi:ribose transport system permease protein